MLAAGSGVIVNVTSRSGMLADSARSAYGSSKAGVDMFTKYVATMYGYANIRCNSVAPASIDSPQDRKRFSTADWQRRAAERLLPRAPRPEDIAAAIAFLCSDDAAAITGQVIVVDSGAGVHRADHAVRAWDTARAGLGAS
jgi:NAD(P)-dependent dehydrogenase (short-subunit alcohol dehydrogenase family)